MNKQKIQLALKIILPVLCGLWLGFIFGQSLQTVESSSSTSSTVVDAVQEVASWFAPDSKIATATGEEYEQLHFIIRKIAHFAEFAVLGALLSACYFVYTKKWNLVWLPVLGVLLFPAMDEGLQLLVSGRVGSFWDVLIDWSGGIVGGFFVGFIFVIIRTPKIELSTVAENLQSSSANEGKKEE